MERNIDRNLRMAKREARRFFGIRRRSPLQVVIFVSLCIALAGYGLLEPHLKDHRFFHGGFLTLGFFILSGLLLWLAARWFGFDLSARRPRRSKRRPY
jgi:hypothetical protein